MIHALNLWEVKIAAWVCPLLIVSLPRNHSQLSAVHNRLVWYCRYYLNCSVLLVIILLCSVSDASFSEP